MHDISAPSHNRSKRLCDSSMRSNPLHPAGPFRIELTERLELPILIHCEEYGTHGSCHLDRVVLRFVLLPCLERFAIVTDVAASVRALARTIYKNAFTGRLVRTNNIRFAARPLHLIERPECGTLRLESCLYGSPFETGMTMHVRFEAGFECSKQAVALLRGKRVRFGHVE